MKKNIPLLKETMQFILDNPEKHDQFDWVSPCGSTKCFAGHAAVLSGAEFDLDIYIANGEDWLVDAEGNSAFWSNSITYLPIDTYAQDKLGLSDTEANYLFSADRSITDLVEAVEKFQEGYSLILNEETDENEWVKE